MGTGHRLAWSRSFLEVLPVSAGAAPEFVVVEGLPTREFLLSLVALPVDALVRVDYAPFAGTTVPEAATVAETVRGEAQRAVLAFELVRRAARIVPLAAIDAECWAASLAALPVLCARDGVRQKLRLCSTHLPR